MATIDSGTHTDLYAPPGWVRIMLGFVLILGGMFVLGDLALATLVSTMFIGLTAIVVGAFEIIHAFWTKGWGGFVWQVLLGILYIAFGLMVVAQPVQGAMILTFVLGLLLLGSGIVRIIMAIRHWGEHGWIMVLSGTIAVLAGLIILTRWPVTGIWVLGLLLAIDLISHGVAWLTYGSLSSAQATAQQPFNRPASGASSE